MDSEATGQWLINNKQLLLEQFDTSDFGRDTWVQIRKDFATFGQDVVDPSEFLAAPIQESIQHSLRELLRSQPSIIPTLLYQIDLPEAAMHILPGYEEEYICQLAEWILVREAYKVYLRRTYSH